MPASIISSSGRLVAEINRTLTLIDLVVTDSRDLVIFQHTQQLDLRAHRHVTDFVQEQSASVGVLKRTFAISNRIGE